MSSASVSTRTRRPAPVPVEWDPTAPAWVDSSGEYVGRERAVVCSYCYKVQTFSPSGVCRKCQVNQ